MPFIYHDSFAVSNGPIDKDNRIALGLEPTRWANMQGTVEIESEKAIGRVRSTTEPNLARFLGRKTGPNDPDFEPDPTLSGVRDFRVDVIVGTEAAAEDLAWRAFPVINFVDNRNYITLVVTDGPSAGELVVSLVEQIDGEQFRSFFQVTVLEPTQPAGIGLASVGGAIQIYFNDNFLGEIAYAALPRPTSGIDPVSVFLGASGRRAGITLGADLAHGGTGGVIDTWILSRAVVRPKRPSIVSASEALYRVRSLLRSTPYESADGSDRPLHIESEWVIAPAGTAGFDTPAWYSNPSESKRFLTIVEAGVLVLGDGRDGLVPDTDYKARVRYLDSNGGVTDWSGSFVFRTPATIAPTSDRVDRDVGDYYPSGDGFEWSEFVQGIIRPTYGVHEKPIAIESRRASNWGVSDSTPTGSGRRFFRGTHGLLSREQANTIWDFYWAKRGRYKAFFFTHPKTGESIRARFLDSTLVREQFEETLTRIGIAFYEVL